MSFVEEGANAPLVIMVNPVTFDVYLRYLQWQSSPAETCAVRTWLAWPAHAAQAQRWMHRYTQLTSPDTTPVGNIPDFDALQTRLLAQLKLVPASVPLVSRTTRLAHISSCFPFFAQEFLGLRAFFHRLHWH